MLATNDIVFSYQRDAVRLTLRSGKALGRMPRAISYQLSATILFYVFSYVAFFFIFHINWDLRCLLRIL